MTSRNLYLLSALMLAGYILFTQLSCTGPDSRQEARNSVVINSVWFSAEQDADSDGYFSSGKIGFLPQVKSGGQDLIFHLYTRQTSLATAGALQLYQQTAPAFITTGANPDTISFRLGWPYAELRQDSYDFFIYAFDPLAVDFVLTEATPSGYAVLGNIPIESDETDVTIKIRHVMTHASQDFDADGYASFLASTIELTSSRPERSVDLILQAVSDQERTIVALDTIFNIYIPDTSLILPLQLYLHSLPAQSYDLRYSLRHAGHSVIEDIYGKAQNFELGDHFLESFSDETSQQISLSYLDQPPYEGAVKYDQGSVNLFQYAVRFFQPDGARLGKIVCISIHGAGAENSIEIRAWTDNNGVPGLDLNPQLPNVKLKEGEWNDYRVDIDITDSPSFFVGYRQLSSSGPFISFDRQLPHSRNSYRRDQSNGLWQVMADGDLAIVVQVQYYTGN